MGSNVSAVAINGDIEGVDAGDLKHGDEESGFVFAVAVTVVKDVAGVIGQVASDTAHDDEVADVFLDEVGNAVEL